jgi:UDP-N-acetylmuramate dehydrogenase
MPEADWLYKALRHFSLLDVGVGHWNEPLSRHSWWQVGGAADYFVEPQSISQVCTLRRSLKELNLPYVVIGDGSNLLFDDQGVRGVVVRIGRALSRFSIRENWVDAEAGIFVPRLARNIGRAGLCGLEHIIGIPGSLGGLVLMNGGSQRNGIGQHVQRIWCVNEQGTIEEYNHEQCQFAYRSSALQRRDVIIVRALLRCENGNGKQIRREMLSNMRSRRSKFPIKQPNCGSVFVSDPSLYATLGPPGKVIEQCGLKGVRLGGAQIAEQHANFIVNIGHAKSADILALIKHIRATVHRQTGFWLQAEVRYVSPDGRVRPAHEAIIEG